MNVANDVEHTGRAPMVPHWLAAVCVSLSAITASCGSDGSAGSTGGCNTLVDDGPAIAVKAVADVPPAPAGGKISDGTYVLSALVLHTRPGGPTTVPAGTSSAVFQVQGATLQQVGSENGVENRYTSTFTTSGTTLTTSDTCPTPKTETHSFTATDAELLVYDATAAGTFEQAYSRR